MPAWSLTALCRPAWGGDAIESECEAPPEGRRAGGFRHGPAGADQSFRYGMDVQSLSWSRLVSRVDWERGGVVAGENGELGQCFPGPARRGLGVAPAPS